MCASVVGLDVRQAGASTPFKRWSKCTMEKVGGKVFAGKVFAGI